MGYLTNYKLTSDIYLGIDLFLILNSRTGYEWNWNEFKLYYLNDAKWYSYHEDMIEISKMYPESLFTLQGEGEENDDLWITYYKNDKFQEAKAVITYEECKL